MADLNGNSNITFFAETDFRGKKTPFGIKQLDRARHMYVIGKTGMGKSTLLENLAIQDIRNGNGMGFLDPHGSSAETLLDYVPENRINDVVYFAPFDLEHPISFNIMEDVGKDKRHLVANGLLASFKKIWPDVWSARMEYILNNTILALLEYPNSTLLGVNRMLSDKIYRNKVVANISDPSVKSFWVDEFAKYNERYMQEAGDAIKNKIGQFTSNPLIRNIIGQPKSSFDIRKLMDEKKLLIVNLSKGRVGEQNANLLGGMLITKIYLAAMSRANLNDTEIKNVPPFYLFVDEFQSFVNDSFADILAEARKYKLNLTIAHQYVDQMPETVRSAVFGNVGTTISFRVGPFDAELLEKIYAPKFTQEDLVNLGFAQIYLTLMIDGVGSAPFSAKTMPRIVNVFSNFKDQIVASSRLQFAKKREEVEAAINEWHEEERTEKDVESRVSAHQSINRFGSGETFRRPENRIRIPESIKKAVVEQEQQRPPVPVPPPPRVEPPPRVPPAPSGLKKEIERINDENKKLPLSALNNSFKKGGASANKDELRAALSQLIKKPEPEKVKPPDVVEKPTPKPDEKKEAVPEDKKPEVPEQVLRNILKVEDQ